MADNSGVSGRRVNLARTVESSIRMMTPRKPVTEMTEEEKTPAALFVDELTGLDSCPAWVRRLLGQPDGRTVRFYLRAFREADPTFGVSRQDSENQLSLEWLVRDARRT